MGIFIGDANNDGSNDIAATNAYNSDISLYLWNITSLNWNPVIKMGGGYSKYDVYIGDANNDGKNDIVSHGGNSVSIRLWNETTGDWEARITRSVGDSSFDRHVIVEDANNDGKNDIVTSNENDDDVSILLWNETSGDWDAQIRRPVGDQPEDVFVGDVNNDGYDDIITANTMDDDVSIILWNETSGDWDSHIRRGMGFHPVSVFMGDANNDGYNDIITSNIDVGASSDDISIRLWNEASNNWDSRIAKLAGNYLRDAWIGDVNNDGLNDIVTANHGSDDISIFLWKFFDTQPPSITVHSPWSMDLFGITAPSFNVRVNDSSGVDTMWYTLDNGLTNVIFTVNGSINQALWENHPDGQVIIRFYANDTIGNTGYVQIYVEKDTSSPQITINSPSDNEFFGVTAPSFDISITEPHLNSTWYTIDDGVTNITFTGLTGAINQIEWDKKISGAISIDFYANDSLGFKGHSEITTIKDIETPNSNIIFTPYIETDQVNRSTLFTLNAEDGSGSGVSRIQYKINNSNWIVYSKPFNLSNYSYGFYNIEFQAIDLVGNVEQVNYIVVKLVKLPSPGPTISGYNNMLIICILGIISTVFIKKKRRLT